MSYRINQLTVENVTKLILTGIEVAHRIVGLETLRCFPSELGVFKKIKVTSGKANPNKQMFQVSLQK